MTIEEQFHYAQAIREYLTRKDETYRIGAMGELSDSEGGTTIAIVLHFQGQSKGVFHSIESLINAIEDSELQARLRKLFP